MNEEQIFKELFDTEHISIEFIEDLNELFSQRYDDYISGYFIDRGI